MPFPYCDRTGFRHVSDKTGAFLTHHIEGKGKGIPLQALTGPEGSRRFRLADFKTIGT